MSEGCSPMLGMAMGQGASFVVYMSPFWLKTVSYTETGPVARSWCMES